MFNFKRQTFLVLSKKNGRVLSLLEFIFLRLPTMYIIPPVILFTLFQPCIFVVTLRKSFYSLWITVSHSLVNCFWSEKSWALIKMLWSKPIQAPDYNFRFLSVPTTKKICSDLWDIVFKNWDQIAQRVEDIDTLMQKKLLLLIHVQNLLNNNYFFNLNSTYLFASIQTTKSKRREVFVLLTFNGRW